MRPIRPENLRKKSFDKANLDRIKGLVSIINQGLVESYNEGENWQFAYNSQRVDNLTNPERLKLKTLFEKVGYKVSFDSGVAYDEKPTEIVISYDTREKN